MRIAETRVIYNDNLWYGSSGGNDTTDKIFLLSLEEVVKYFGDSGQFNRPRREWVFNDQYNSARVARDANGQVSWWWLRSPGVYIVGNVSIGGYFVFSDAVGVRPVLWINL